MLLPGYFIYPTPSFNIIFAVHDKAGIYCLALTTTDEAQVDFPSIDFEKRREISKLYKKAKTMNQSGKTIVAVLTGVSVGIIAGILIAPQSGKRTREDIRYSVQKVNRDLDRFNWQLTNKANKLQRDIKDRADQIRSFVR